MLFDKGLDLRRDARHLGSSQISYVWSQGTTLLAKGGFPITGFE